MYVCILFTSMSCLFTHTLIGYKILVSWTLSLHIPITVSTKSVSNIHTGNGIYQLNMMVFTFSVYANYPHCPCFFVTGRYGDLETPCLKSAAKSKAYSRLTQVLSDYQIVYVSVQDILCALIDSFKWMYIYKMYLSFTLLFVHCCLHGLSYTV